MKIDELGYGPVFITDGPYMGCIGECDNEVHPVEFEYEGSPWDPAEYPENVDASSLAIVFLGDPVLAADVPVPVSCIRQVTTQDLLNRREYLAREIALSVRGEQPSSTEALAMRCSALIELSYIDGVVIHRLLSARDFRTAVPKRVFLSHSSKDKHLARRLKSDLQAVGHSAWLDEDEIAVGESIAAEVERAVDSADAIVVLLTRNAAASRWVQTEWQAKYHVEVESGKVGILTALFESCSIPAMLSAKKYADFREDYNNGLSDLVLGLEKAMGGARE